MSDIRLGGAPTESKILEKVTKKHGTDMKALEAKSLTISSNTDYIKITYHHVICPDANLALVSFTYLYVTVVNYDLLHLILRCI